MMWLVVTVLGLVWHWHGLRPPRKTHCEGMNQSPVAIIAQLAPRSTAEEGNGQLQGFLQQRNINLCFHRLVPMVVIVQHSRRCTQQSQEEEGQPGSRLGTREANQSVQQSSAQAVGSFKCKTT